MILHVCILNDEILKVLDFTLWNIILKLFHNLQIGEPLPTFTSEKLPLWDGCFKHSHVTEPLPVNLISCRTLLHLFLLLLSTYSAFWSSVASFWIEGELIFLMQRWSEIFLCATIKKYGFIRFANPCILILFQFSRASQHVQNSLCTVHYSILAICLFFPYQSLI